MKTSLAVQELFDKGLWIKVCNLKGWNEWIVKEGLMSSDEKVTFTEEEIKQLGIKL